VYESVRATNKDRKNNSGVAMLKLVEKNIISKRHSNYQEIDKLWFSSKKVNYLVRQ